MSNIPIILQKEQPICILCNINLVRKNGVSKNGFIRYQKHCNQCHKIAYNFLNKNWSYRLFKKDKCEFCGFIPVNKCQLDVDHIDGNHKNNNESNLQTLCANCHRLKTYNDRLLTL